MFKRGARLWVGSIPGRGLHARCAMCYQLDLMCYQLDLMCYQLDLMCYQLDLMCYQLDLMCYQLDLMCYQLDLMCYQLDLMCYQLDLMSKGRLHASGKKGGGAPVCGLAGSVSSVLEATICMRLHKCGSREVSPPRLHGVRSPWSHMLARTNMRIHEHTHAHTHTHTHTHTRTHTHTCTYT